MATTGVGVPTPADLRMRKRVDGLSDAELADLRAAFSAVYAIDDDRGYAYHAGIHGLPLPISCQHHNRLFLPWHRAYLYFFEQALQDQVAGVDLPWWDYYGGPEPAVPEAYAQERVGRRANPLAHGPISGIPKDQWDRIEGGRMPSSTSRAPGELAPFPPESDVQRALDAPTFTDLSNFVESVHDNIHVWVGSTMSEIPVAAFDPLFWAHHCMIDRLWYLWQLRHPGGDPTGPILQQALPPFPMTVAETLDINALGYEYAAVEVAVPAGTP
jgi:tyrosinase